MGTTKLMLVIMAICCCGLSGHAQTAPNVPEVATQEIARRGAHVEQTGTIRSGLMAEALKPPEDDSDRWFLTLIHRPGDAQSVTLKRIVEQSPAMKPWINAGEPSRSTMHYQARDVDDVTQADWLHGLRPALARSGIPCVVIQPPRNGRFGDNKVIAKMIHGVPAGVNITQQAEELSKRLRDGIVTYVEQIEGRGQEAGDRGQKSAGRTLALNSPPSTLHPNGIGVPPPFDAKPRPRDDAPPADEPVEWPPLPPPHENVPGPPSNPVPSSPATPLDWWTGALLIGAGIAGTLGATRLAKWLAEIAVFVREIQDLKGRLPPPSPPA